jgi:4'-phosphopantetheinyl transferase
MIVSTERRVNGIWNVPPGDYALLRNEVHIWRALLDQPQGSLNLFHEALSAEERAQAERFHFEADRRRAIIGRGLARLLLGYYLGIPAQQIEFKYNAFGKPALADSRLPFQFNVSHSGDVILVATAIDRVLGVDVERIKPDMATAEIAARFFSPHECRTLLALPSETRREAFFACWTRKEAYLKARGDGLSLALDSFDVAFAPADAPRLLATRHDPAEVSRYTLCALDAGPGYAAALAVEGSNWRLTCWEWPHGGRSQINPWIRQEAPRDHGRSQRTAERQAWDAAGRATSDE